jgi:hypothetical protein
MTNHNDNDNDNDNDNALRPNPEPVTPTPVKATPEPEGFSTGVVVVLNLMAFLLVAMLLAWILSSAELRGRFVPFTQEDWGTVKTIRYVGSFGPTTQVDTDRKTFLLKGTANIDQGTRVVRRKDYFGQAICIDGTKTCWELVGN